jgi:hypothetical protein
MEFNLRNCERLPSPLIVDGRSYTIIGHYALSGHEPKRIVRVLDRMFLEAPGKSAAVIFDSPRGKKVEILFYTSGQNESYAHLQVYVDGIEVTPERINDTLQITDPGLRGLVEKALRDVMAAEVRLDPSGWHADRRRLVERQAQAAAERERALRDL